MTARTLVLSFVFAAAAACQNSDIGKACDKVEDCGSGLICDVHDGKGTCQEPHDHGSAGESEHSHETEGHATEGHATEGHATEGHVTEGHATEGHATEGHATEGHATEGHATEGPATSGSTGGEDTAQGGQIGDACAVKADCSGDLICDVHDGAGTCQEPHDHVQG